MNNIKFEKSKILILVAMIGISITACSTNKAEVNNEQSVKFSAPSTCEQSKVVAAFDAQVKGSKYVPTDWQPSEGTDLFDAINNGGIACSYGIQVAEVGGTILWANNSNGLWDKKEKQWLADGQQLVDLPGLDEDKALMLKEGSIAADEMHVWGVNVLYKGVWIQLNASFLQNIDEAMPIIKSAIDSLVTS